MTDLRPEAIQEVIDDVLKPIGEDEKQFQDRMEMLYRRLGWFIAWALFMEGPLRDLWETVSIESEIVLDRGPLWTAVTPDRVLRSKNHGYLKYLEYKTTISASKKWLDSWKSQIQIHTSLAAIQEELKEKVKFAQVVGLMKGYASTSDHRLIHPYVWAYRHKQTGAWTHEYQRSPEWESMPVWDYPGGIVEWVLKCGQSVAFNQFPHTEPLFLNERMLDLWVTRRLARERQIACVEDLARKDEKVKQIYFPMIQSQCRPAFGDACPYQLVCWNASVAANPLACEEYEDRKPHHDLEIIGMEL